MMLDLGKYAGAVIGSYAASVALIVALVALSLWRGAKIKQALRDVEVRQGKDNA